MPKIYIFFIIIIDSFQKMCYYFIVIEIWKAIPVFDIYTFLFFSLKLYMKKHVVTTCFFHFVYFAINLKKLDENQVKAADVDGDNKATNN